MAMAALMSSAICQRNDRVMNFSANVRQAASLSRYSEYYASQSQRQAGGLSDSSLRLGFGFRQRKAHQNAAKGTGDKLPPFQGVPDRRGVNTTAGLRSPEQFPGPGMDH